MVPEVKKICQAAFLRGETDHQGLLLTHSCHRYVHPRIAAIVLLPDKV